MASQITLPVDGGVVRVSRQRPPRPRWLGPTIDYGPIAVFFLVYAEWDLFPATAAMLVATVVVLALSLALTRHVPTMALFTSAMVLVFGGLTLWLNDETYLKLQSTLISAIFSLALFGALALQRPLLRGLFGAALPVSDAGWRLLTLRCALFFAALAGLNEIIVRTQSTEIWVEFNVFGSTALGLAFALAQWPLIKRHLVGQLRIKNSSQR